MRILVCCILVLLLDRSVPVRTQQGEVSPAPPPAMDSHKGVNLTTATADAPRAEALVQKQELVESTLSEMPRAEALYRAAAPGTSPEKESDDMSPADKLRAAAKKAGYDITDLTVDLASSATEEELTEMLPQPLAEALISRRRSPDLRDRLIGMTFLGQPIPLDRRIRKRPFLTNTWNIENRRRSQKAPNHRRPYPSFPRGRMQDGDVLASAEASPRVEILKPVSFPASRTRIIFPELTKPGRSSPSNSRNRPQGSPARPGSYIPGKNGISSHSFIGKDANSEENSFDGIKNIPFDGSDNNNFEVFDLREAPAINNNIRRPVDERSVIRDNLGNDVSSDFGPVIYEVEYNDNEAPLNSFTKLDKPSSGNKNKSRFPPSNFPKSRQPTSAPKPFSPSKPFSTSFANFGNSFNQPELAFTRSPNQDPKSGCTQYTETLCLDADNYPHAEILASLVGDKGRTGVLIAEVRNQSADDLVDGISARQEEQYNFSHYFGNENRRQDSEGHRDFADDGGYLCPSEVMYARPKRGRNSKGEWKFIVNMDKYTQTIRMEKCIKPGGACSYVSHHYQAMCNQVHNYQRLLAWEKKRGLHMDIFKVPSCCTCHIQGYSFVFPPLKEGKPEQRSDTKENLRETSFLSNRAQHKANDKPLNNGGPFNTPNQRQRPFENSSIRRNRRPSSPVLSNEVRRMDVDHEVDEMGLLRDRRPGISRGQDVPRRVRQQSNPSTRRGLDHSSVRRPSRGPDRTRQDSDAKQSSINYDYHPILQFFEGYEK